MEKVPKKQDKVFQLPDERKVVFVPTEPNASEWVQRDYIEPIELTEQEQLKAASLKYDAAKVLKVKIALVEGKTPTEIEKQDKVSRSSVHKYKKILSEKHIEKLKKDRQNTKKVKSVFPIWLIPCFLSAENTNPHSWGLLFLFFLMIWVWLQQEWKKQKQARIKHRENTAKLRRLFHHVFDLSYRQYPIVVDSKKEADHWRKLLKEYNNSGRMVHHLERLSGQTNTQHWAQKEKFASDYKKANAHRIREGEERAAKEMEKLESLGLLDYFYWSRKDSDLFETSRDYLFKTVAFYAKHETVPTEDKARSKRMFDLIPEELKN
ncbi:hypothetical protein [Aureispira sp. CCB-QB1]|uniref:hypothetical protein n=1 Tax=Aureispira sp. CCB-QB1 TaxID=1313421 RepID=UPI0006991205|nr:hypothetical protein [Aureispira sp. CCB-QB1]